MSDQITFSFGKNWKNYSKTISDKSIEYARDDIEEWLGKDDFTNQRILDIGSGSGIHSLIFFQKKALEIISFDYDIYSVEATKNQWGNCGSPENWKVTQGSILDDAFISSLGKFNIVYSWGVLHHTGAMWQAIENALSLVDKDGLFFVSIYTKGDLYTQHLAIKQKYNQASPLGKKMMEWRCILSTMKHELKQGKNPLAWNQTKERGMNVYYDIVDWLGGLPYEVASPKEMNEFCQKFGFELIKIKEANQGGCSQYLFHKTKYEK
jgi:2-polyprenyl-6-hydroxyphenyl methylase/3-demethylubiquinone-9 3-methyltransferase